MVLLNFISSLTPFPRKMLWNFLAAPTSHAIRSSFWWLFLHLHQADIETRAHHCYSFKMTSSPEKTDAKLEKDKKESVWKQSQHMLKTRRLKIAPHPRESHPTCCGPDLTWQLFNINGHSPLIHHFLQSCNAEPRSGQDILIHRREISNPIPYP
ncbi:LOW QUALITY PROTEIN: protein FAM227A [Theristicus caerulescens]